MKNIFKTYRTFILILPLLAGCNIVTSPETSETVPFLQSIMIPDTENTESLFPTVKFSVYVARCQQVDQATAYLIITPITHTAILATYDTSNNIYDAFFGTYETKKPYSYLPFSNMSITHVAHSTTLHGLENASYKPLTENQQHTFLIIPANGLMLVKIENKETRDFLHLPNTTNGLVLHKGCSQKWWRNTSRTITAVRQNQVIVFGAISDQIPGLNKHHYAIPIMATSARFSRPYIYDFITFATEHPELEFLVTRLSCGSSTLPINEVAPFFSECADLDNVSLPPEYWEVLGY